jgi:MtN3 and saliva related transmembrane protein
MHLRQQFPKPKHGALMDFTTLIGLAAAFCTTISYYPQLKKCWETGSAGDLSLKMFLTLATGVALWVVYGFLKSDLVIIIAKRCQFGPSLRDPLLQAAGTARSGLSHRNSSCGSSF